MLKNVLRLVKNAWSLVKFALLKTSSFPPQRCWHAFYFAAIAQIFVRCALNFAHATLLIVKRCVSYVLKFVRPARLNVKNMLLIMNIARNAQRLVGNV